MKDENDEMYVEDQDSESRDDKMEEDSNEQKTSSENDKLKGKNEEPGDVYLPSQPINEGEELVCDESAYIILRQVSTGAPCLSFDIIDDEMGDNRSEYPLTCYVVAGTQAANQKENNIIVMKLSNMHKTHRQDDDDKDSSDSDSDEDEDEQPSLDYASMAHFGCINRIRAAPVKNTILAATWSEMGRVSIWNLQKQIQAVNDLKLLSKYRNDNEIVNSKPLFTFSGHQAEGFAIDWSPTVPGFLASGDCKKNIHLWHVTEDGWQVDQKPLIGHTASVEDLQWSPNEPHVLASASVDKSIRIWDTRASAQKACMITVNEAHTSDVNVIHWNRNEPFIASGGDDGCLKIWDLRQLKSAKPVATFKHHTGPVTTVEWHPSEGTVVASGEDNQIALWDLSAERDEESANDIQDVPPQLLFIHLGQQDIKELHWHKQIPGLIISTAYDGFNVFKTISI